MRSLSRFLLQVAIMALPLASCADERAVRVAYAPEWTRPTHGTVSVLGVYRDGRMDAEPWKDMEAKASQALGGSSCSAAFGGAWRGSDAEAAVDSEARASGIDDEWLAKVATRAEGDYVLVVAEEREPAPVSPGNGGSSGSSSGIGKGKGVLLLIPLLPVLAGVLVADAISKDAAKSHPPEPTSDFVGMLFSRADGKTVVAVHSRVKGMSERDARQAFAARLGESLPYLSCGGWKAPER